MTNHESTDVSRLLLAWRDGDDAAFEQLVPLVYDQLHALARRHLAGEKDGHTLQTTALINEAYLRLVGAEVEWEGRKHFLAIAARTMRRLLVDHARTKERVKRGAGVKRVPLEEAIAIGSDASPELPALDEALDQLGQIHERKALAVELHYFGGLTYDETAEVLGVSKVTVHRDLRMATAWLYQQLSEEAGGGQDPGGRDSAT